MKTLEIKRVGECTIIANMEGKEVGRITLDVADMEGEEFFLSCSKMYLIGTADVLIKRVGIYTAMIDFIIDEVLEENDYLISMYRSIEANCFWNNSKWRAGVEQIESDDLKDQQTEAIVISKDGNVELHDSYNFNNVDFI